MTPFLQHNSKRLANTLETKEAEFQMKEEEYQSDLQMKDHFDAGLEIKVLDLLLENALLKNQIASLSDTTTMKNTTK